LQLPEDNWTKIKRVIGFSHIVTNENIYMWLKPVNIFFISQLKLTGINVE
jgi:hypothetical protein